MIEESKTMKELHDIREKNSELYKSITIEEQIQYTREKADMMKKKIEDIRKGNKASQFNMES